MLLLRFFHNKDELIVGDKSYRATCKVRNEINQNRAEHQVVKTYPVNGDRKPYYPRKFPTGLWKVKDPIWTEKMDYWPVKIPTDAVRRVVTWETNKNGYKRSSGEIQDDAFYHLHFAKNSRTTLGCIRLSSESDAREIARQIEKSISAGEEVWLEVLVGKGE